MVNSWGKTHIAHYELCTTKKHEVVTSVLHMAYLDKQRALFYTC